MRRPTLAFAAVLGFAAVDVVACNTISGVGDFTFASASSASGSGGSGATTETSGSVGGSTPGSGGSGGVALAVACPKMKCPVTPDAGACCYDNPTEHATASGRCVDGPRATDGCDPGADDAGKETRIECSGPADCPGGSCCATYGGMDPDAGGAWYSIVTCKPVCGASDITLCDPNATKPCPDPNHNGDSCDQSQLLPSGYFICP